MANGCLLRLKLGEPDPDGQFAAAAEEFRFILAASLEGLGRSRYRGDMTEVAQWAASIGSDRVRSCRMYFDSHVMEVILLQLAWAAWGKAMKGESLALEAVDPFPTWYEILLDLIFLTRRTWTYVRLANTRAIRVGWIGQLARIYLGHQSRQALLAGDRSLLRRIRQDLDRGLDRMGEEAPEDRPADEALWLINRAASHGSALLGDAIPEARAQAALEILDQLLLHCPPGGYTGSGYEHLPIALNRIVAILGPLRAHVADAIRDLFVETRGPRPPAPPTGVQFLLERLSPDHGDEMPVARVLDAIRENWPEPTQDPLHTEVPRVLSRAEILDAFHGRLEAETPEWAVFLSLVMSNDFDDVRQILRYWLPGPAAMLPSGDLRFQGWLARAGEILKEWDSVLRSPREDALEWMEIPSTLRKHPEGARNACGALAGWIAAPRAAPRRWWGPGGVGPEIEPWIRGALLIVILEQLVEHLGEIYRTGREEKGRIGENAAGMQPPP